MFVMPNSATDDYYRQLCEHLGVALIATDLDLKIVAWNLAASRIFGARSDRMIGTPIEQILPQHRRNIATRMLRRAMDTGETVQLEFEQRDQAGDRRKISGTIAPVLNDAGQRIGASVCIRDITKRIDLQAELYENRKMVALGEMAGAMAHHFNNILGGVITSIDYANASQDAQLCGRVLRQAGDALQRAVTLVDGLLAFAEGDRRAGDLADVSELVTQLADVIEPELEKAGVELNFQLAPMPSVAVARTPLNSVLRNIIHNGVEAMPNGGTLSFDVSQNGAEVVILISDTGCGLDEASKQRIFEPFWSTKGALGSDLEGHAGLGLAVVHGLVHMMSGTITVTSQVGKGSCFRVTLPIPS